MLQVRQLLWEVLHRRGGGVDDDSEPIVLYDGVMLEVEEMYIHKALSHTLHMPHREWA